MFLAAGALVAASSIRRGLSLMGAVTGRPGLGGYGAFLTRPEVTQPDLLTRRAANDDQFTTTIRTTFHRLIERTKAEYDRYIDGTRKEPPVIDVLIISGGGDWGAFGAGFLKGWLKIPPQHPLAMPEFDAVTGVSTGTLIAPFAFLGDEQSIDQIVNLYRNPQKDWVKHRGVLYFLPDNMSFAEVPGWSARYANTSPWTWLAVSHVRAPMAGSWQSARPTLIRERRGCSTWWRKRNAPPIPASLTAFTTSCSPRQGFPARFRSG